MELYGNQNPMPLFSVGNRASLGYNRENNKQPCHTPKTTEKLGNYVKTFAENLFREIGLRNLSKTTSNNFPIMYPCASFCKHHNGHQVEVIIG